MDDLREALSSLSQTVAFDPRYLRSGDRHDAWLYCILAGWDDEEECLQELVQQHGWSEDQVEWLRRFRAAIQKARSGAD